MPARARSDEPSSLTGALESVGVACARAAIVALVVGLVEGVLLGRRFGVPSTAMGLAAAGVWFPASLLALLPGALLVRIGGDSKVRRIMLVVVGVLLAGCLAFAATAPPTDVALGSPLRALPLEIVGAISVAWGASSMRFEGAMKRPAAYVGIALAVLLQLYANRWIDVHRALAGAMAESSFIPRFMLRVVLRRFA